VQLAKPYDEQRIQEAKNVVAQYLNDDDSWVRHECVWFLASWCRLIEYEPQVVEMMLHDADEDNRGFAANCLGTLRAKLGGENTVDVLRGVVLNEHEAEPVRVKAYGAMREIAGESFPSAGLFDFQIGEKTLNDVDWEWVRRVSNST